VSADHPNPDITVDVDLRNPGQFFACCGLLELASRLWPGSEGWFAGEGSRAAFHISTGSGDNDPLGELVRKLHACTIAGLTDAERRERKQLESRKRSLSKPGEKLPEALEQRRNELGRLAREGAVHLGTPFELTLDWWQAGYEGSDDSKLKTWAGNQGPDGKLNELKDETWRLTIEANHGLCIGSNLLVERTPMTGRLGFDPSASWKALDVGFSPDEQDIPVRSSPATEILAAIGLQRCRPLAVKNKVRWFAYRIWKDPLHIAVVPAAIAGVIPTAAAYEFPVVMRNKQYGSFSWAQPLTERRMSNV
jgi:CRISPR-associated protein Csx14